MEYINHTLTCVTGTLKDYFRPGNRPPLLIVAADIYSPFEMINLTLYTIQLELGPRPKITYEFIDKFIDIMTSYYYGSLGRYSEKYDAILPIDNEILDRGSFRWRFRIPMRMWLNDTLDEKTIPEIRGMMGRTVKKSSARYVLPNAYAIRLSYMNFVEHFSILPLVVSDIDITPTCLDELEFVCKELNPEQDLHDTVDYLA